MGWTLVYFVAHFLMWSLDTIRCDAIQCRASKMVLDWFVRECLDRGYSLRGLVSMLFASVLFGEMGWAIEGEGEGGRGMGMGMGLGDGRFGGVGWVGRWSPFGSFMRVNWSLVRCDRWMDGWMDN